MQSSSLALPMALPLVLLGVLGVLLGVVGVVGVLLGVLGVLLGVLGVLLGVLGVQLGVPLPVSLPVIPLPVEVPVSLREVPSVPTAVLPPSLPPPAFTVT